MDRVKFNPELLVIDFDGVRMVEEQTEPARVKFDARLLTIEFDGQRMVERRYSEDQPRDPDGKFGEGGGTDGDSGGSGGAQSGIDKSREMKNTLLRWQVVSSAISRDAASEIKTGIIASEQGHRIVEGIRNESAGGKDIHRGIAVAPASPIMGWKVGDTTEILPASFSKDEEVATDFAHGRLTKTLSAGVVFHMHGRDDEGKDARGIEVGARGYTSAKGELEVITGGKFRVTSVKDEKKLGRVYRNIWIRQIGVFKPKSTSRTAARTEQRYSPDQPRDPDGKFGEGGGEAGGSEAGTGTGTGVVAAELNEALFSWQETSVFEGAAAEKAIVDGKPESNILVMGIRQETYDADIYRGIFLSEEDEPMSWKPADEVQMMPSSFSTDMSVAARFASGEPQGLKGEPGFTQVILHVSPMMANGLPARGITVGTRGNPAFIDDKEVVSGGHYRVQSVRDKGSTRRISLLQVGVF